MAILKLFFSFLMLMIYLTSVMANMHIHIDSLIIYRNSPFYNDINNGKGGELVAKPDAKSKCCNNHPKLGKYEKCWNYCITDCERGGICKRMPGGHRVCHCAC
ncbi:hypothetical protein ES332_A02G071700v1 [Gossypium tomentosum]|uniref:Knottin scorpion toxin-like domain-containing protein n=1 Tax=Gossypium tomentosum TaxID=34277 RepID=A0A5D2RFH3_GOSTO|nr:hypothetical protein ES332_A02G071700v1 [Gossypium tomentosum]